MKGKLIFMVMMLSLIALPLQSQWNIGGVIITNISSISVTDAPSSESYSSRVVFGFGFVVDRPLFGQFDLHVEAVLQQKGCKIEEFGDDVAFKLSYLELPIMLQYNIGTNGSIQPYIMAGPSLGFLLSGKYDVKDGPVIDAKDELKGMDFSLGIGGGVNIPMNKLIIFVDARFMLGLTNINDEPDESAVRNRGFQIAVGAIIPVGK